MFGRHARGLAREKEKAQDSVGAIRRLLGYFRPYVGLMVVVGVLLVLNSLLEILAPYLIELAIDQFILPKAQRAPAGCCKLRRKGSRRRPGWRG